MLINHLLTERAQSQPAKLAVIVGERSITYAELDVAVESMARHFIDRGLKSGDRVGVHWHNSVEYVVLMMGAWRSGLVLVPINPRLKAAEIAYILEHSGARFCFSEPVLAPLVDSVKSGVEVITQLAELTQGGERLPDPDPDAPAMIIYTSGTTARPKGVVHTQRTLFEGARECADVAVGSFERPLALSQMAHIAALVCAYLPGLIRGTSVVLLRSFEAGAALDTIERFHCTNIFALPVFLQLMAEEQARHPRDVSSVQGIAAGGDCVALAVQRRIWELFHVEVLEGCGMTEAVPTAFNRPGAARPGSIGVAGSASIRIIDRAGNDVEPGETGEMVIRSAWNCIGYWNDPEATARLLEDGWLHTGDLVSRDEDGYLWFKGRLKQIIIRGGSNISPQEVEEAFYQHPDVLEAGVVGLPDPTFGEVPVAFVSLREGRNVETDRLLASVRTLLADYKTPEHIYFMDQLPKGLTGKVDRRRLREILLADPNLIESGEVVRV
jgi:acyl-CoA synthetase (AMP-forming)/AMP-acid ligase II